MGLISNKISIGKVKEGDHIYAWRTLWTYAHHGIYVGNGKVIHFTCRGETTGNGTFTPLGKAVNSSSPSILRWCPSCRDRTNVKNVIITCLECFLEGDNLHRYDYGVSRVAFLATPRGGTNTLAASDPLEDVLRRARYLLSEDGFGDYDFLKNNCENFALYCKTGLIVAKKTGQANSLSAASVSAAVLFAVGLTTVSYGTYSYGRFVSDIGWKGREDVYKIPVEELVALNKQH